MKNLNTAPFAEDLQNALQALRQGKTILYPTDTIWGLGCDATKDSAVQRIIDIKQRPAEKSFIILVSSLDMMCRYVDILPQAALQLIEFANKPLTVIFESVGNLAESVYATDGSVGIRWCKDPFCNALIHKLGKPIVSTSANVSGKPSPTNYHDIEREVKDGVDYVVKHRQREGGKQSPSTIVKIKNNNEIIFIRK